MVHAPFMKRLCEKRLHVPHRHCTPVSACFAASFSTMMSKLASVSAMLPPVTGRERVEVW